MLIDDQRRLAAIEDATDPKEVLQRIFAFWGDADRAERVPVQLLYLHLGMLTAMCMALLDVDLPVQLEARRLAERVLGIQWRPGVLGSVNKALHAVDSPWGIEIRDGQAVAVPATSQCNEEGRATG